MGEAAEGRRQSDHETKKDPEEGDLQRVLSSFGEQKKLRRDDCEIPKVVYAW